MKKYLTLLILFMYLGANSQTKPVYDFQGNVTYVVGDTIKVPYGVAKQIVKDLIKGDSVKAELDLTRQQLTLTEQKVSLKDTVIKFYQEKEDYYVQLIQAEKSRASLWRGQYKQLKADYRKVKVQNVLLKVSLGLITGTLGTLYILK